MLTPQGTIPEKSVSFGSMLRLTPWNVTQCRSRTPMAAILGSVDLLANHLARLTPSKRQELFSRITQSLGRMTTMLNDVLTLNRVDAERRRKGLPEPERDIKTYPGFADGGATPSRTTRLRRPSATEKGNHCANKFIAAFVNG